MNLLEGGLFQAALQAFLPSFPPARVVTASPHDPPPKPQQTHVLRTKPPRGSMPADRTLVASASSATGKKKETHVGSWLDKNDPISSDPIEVSDDSDNKNSRASSPSRHIVERVSAVKARKAITKQKQPQISPLLRDGPRLFGDRLRPDANGVPIPIPGAGTDHMKSGPLRPINTINGSGPLAAKSVSRTLSHSDGGGRRSEASPYFTSRVLRKKTPNRSQASGEEGPARKKRRLRESIERNMSKDSPIVIDDDVEMGEQDELALSSDKRQVYSATTKKHLLRDMTKASKDTSITAAARIDEFHAVENMMKPSKPAPRKSLQVLERNDTHDDSLSSRESSEDELFTKASKQQRLKIKGDGLPDRTPAQGRNGNLAAAEAGKPMTHQVPAGIFYSSPSRPTNDEFESPDALQVSIELPHKGGQASQVPLHKASGSTLANAFTGGADEQVGHTKVPKSKAMNGRRRHRGVLDFNLRQLRYGPLPKDYEYMIRIDEDRGTLSIRPQSAIMQDEITKSISLRRVSNIYYSVDGCTGVMLVMSRAQDAIDDKMHLELQSEKEVWDFVTTVQQLAGGNTDLKTKDSLWLQSALERHEHPKSRHRGDRDPNEGRTLSNIRRPTPSTPSHVGVFGVSGSVRSHDRIVDHFEASHHTSKSPFNGIAIKSPAIIPGKARGTVGAVDSTSADMDHAQGSKKEKASPNTGTVSNYFQPRATRSSAVNNVASNYLDDTAKPEAKFSQTGKLGTPWQAPLVYPKTGKKRETVDFQDLERLDDDEFLNDNLVGFYLRYLEHYLEKKKPEVAKKVYFFNSYFFERLTQTQKGSKGINYAAVEKWTRTIDIFSRDFVVVPVNENLHWYVAIICNLPHLRRKLADDDEDDEVESIATSETVRATKSETEDTAQITQDLLDEPEGETSSSFAGLSLGDKDEATLPNEDHHIVTSDVKLQSSPKQKKGPGRRKSARRSLIKIDPGKPVVITLDSLGLSRTATRTTLKDYIVEEGKAKRSLDLERGALEGVTAKGIPTQKNYSDCGLFLCAYMEKFVLDPYQFIRDILQRDMDDGKDWPMMSSHELRSRLRNVIMELHRQQEGEKEMVPIPDVGSILLRRPLPRPLHEFELDSEEVPPETQSASAYHVDEEAASQVNNELIAAATSNAQGTLSPELSQSTALRAAEDAVNRPSPEKDTAGVRQSPQAAIVISDDSPDSRGPRHMSARFRSHANLTDDFVDGPEQLESNPQALAERMRRDRSPASAPIQRRSQSVNTDFMTGLESYARESSPDNMPGRWADGEVPETQSQAIVMAKPEEEDELGQEILEGI